MLPKVQMFDEGDCTGLGIRWLSCWADKLHRLFVGLAFPWLWSSPHGQIKNMGFPRTSQNSEFGDVLLLVPSRYYFQDGKHSGHQIAAACTSTPMPAIVHVDLPIRVIIRRQDFPPA